MECYGRSASGRNIAGGFERRSFRDADEHGHLCFQREGNGFEFAGGNGQREFCGLCYCASLFSVIVLCASVIIVIFYPSPLFFVIAYAAGFARIVFSDYLVRFTWGDGDGVVQQHLECDGGNGSLFVVDYFRSASCWFSDLCFNGSNLGYADDEWDISVYSNGER